ncbi:MAG: YwbE family protein [Crocinitomicaceae bacterium]
MSKYSGGQVRENIKIGSEVEVIQKYDQSSGALTWGIVKRILTKSPNHTHGIKVMLESKKVGRVKTIISEDE